MKSNDDKKFQVRVKEIIPESTYDGKVYTQLVLIEFANGQLAYVLDQMHCSQEMVKTRRIIALKMMTLGIEKSTEKKKQEIIPDPSAPFFEIIGCINKISSPDISREKSNWVDAIIDFGVGRLCLNIDKKYSSLNLKEGDYIRSSGRVDLISIE
jgi:hypothetical protein